MPQKVKEGGADSKTIVPFIPQSASVGRVPKERAA